METSLKGKVAYVTGGARRVGRGFVLGMAQAGAHVVIHHSGTSAADAEQTAAAARAHGVEALIVTGDIGDPVQVTACFAQAEAAFGRVDVLVNSASNFESVPLLDMTPDDWAGVMNVNLNGAFYATQAAGRLMRARGQGGVIINIADNAGLRPWAKRPAHSVSKAGLIMLTQVTARALAPYQVRANCLVLGPVLITPGMTDNYWESIQRRLPLKRAGDPDDAARAAVFLAQNDFITGAVIRIDGGEWLGDATNDQYA